MDCVETRTLRIEENEKEKTGSYYGCVEVEPRLPVTYILVAKCDPEIKGAIDRVEQCCEERSPLSSCELNE